MEGPGCSAGRGRCFQRLWPPTSGLAQRRQWRGAQLDWELALDGSGSQLRAWPGGVPEGCSAGRGTCSQLGGGLAPLAANFGPGWPGPEAAAEGRPTRRGVYTSLSFRVAHWHCFGFGSEATVKGHMDKRVASLRLSPPTSGR